MGEAFGGKQTQTSSTQINRQLAKHGQFALGEARNLYENQEPLPSQYVGISQERQGALSQISGIAGRGDVARTGLGEWNKVMSGAYLDPDSNPWMQEIVDRSVGASMSAPQSGFARGGRFGSGAMANAQADAGQNTAARLWGGNYNMERANMMAAMGQTGAAQQLQYADPLMQGRVGLQYEQDEANRQAEQMRQWQNPYAQLEQYQSYLTGNPLMAESTTSTVSKQPFQWGQALIGAAGGLFTT